MQSPGSGDHAGDGGRTCKVDRHVFRIAADAPAGASWTGRTQYSDALNASLGVQQNIGHSLVLDVSCVGAWAQHQPTTNEAMARIGAL